MFQCEIKTRRYMRNGFTQILLPFIIFYISSVQIRFFRFSVGRLIFYFRRTLGPFTPTKQTRCKLTVCRSVLLVLTFSSLSLSWKEFCTKSILPPFYKIAYCTLKFSQYHNYQIISAYSIVNKWLLLRFLINKSITMLQRKQLKEVVRSFDHMKTVI